MKQIQARQNSEWIRVNIDETARHNIDRIHDIVRELLGIRMSDSVLIRRAIWLYRLHFAEAALKMAEADMTQEERLATVSRWCSLERKNINEAAEGTEEDF